MKKVFAVFLMPLCFAACSGSGSGTSTTATGDSSSAMAAAPAAAPAAAVTLPYTAVYSSNFVAGKQADVATVLNSYKDWETGDMNAMKSTYGDSVEGYFPNGYVFHASLDSFMHMASKFRDSLAKVELTFYAWTSNHSVDKNEDWVNVWYKEIDTYKKGRVDSMEYEDDNRLKEGKIVWFASHQQKLKM
jgi:hypothetical protein